MLTVLIIDFGLVFLSVRASNDLFDSFMTRLRPKHNEGVSRDTSVSLHSVESGSKGG